MNEDEIIYESEYEIVEDEEPDHAFRTEIPNVLAELRLPPIAVALYYYFKHTCGQKSTYYKKQKTITAEIGISKATYIKYRNILAEPQPLLGGKPLIRVEVVKIEKFNLPTRITVVNIWRENGDFYRDKNKITRSKFKRGVVQNLNEGRLKFKHKQEPLEQDQKNNNSGADPVAVFPILKEVKIPEKEKIWITNEYRNEPQRVEHAIKVVTHKDFEVKKTLEQAIKWACREQPEIPKTKEDTKKQAELNAEMNHKFASKISESCPDLGWLVERNVLRIQNKGTFNSWQVLPLTDEVATKFLRSVAKKYNVTI